MNVALKTIQKALEVLPSNVLLEIVETEWYYDEANSYVHWKCYKGRWEYSARITEGVAEMYNLFMCNIDTETGTWQSMVFLQDKRLMVHPEEEEN